MNASDDYAIVIGIKRYPTLGEGGNPLDLDGPENDVDGIVNWLKTEGQVPSDHIVEVKYPGNSSQENAPTPSDLEKAIIWLDTIAAQNSQEGNGRQVGRRLYIYMSGHGFSPAQLRGCLFTPNATERAGYNVHATGWLSWLQDSGYFHEFVLWMDCCMNRSSFLPPGEPPLRPTVDPKPAGPSFVAFAAQRPLKAVEASILEDEGKMHGVFTWALLEGLRGAAVDSSGRITGRSLADWIRNAQSNWMQPADWSDEDVSLEPWVIREDADLFFARGIAQRKYRIELFFSNTAIGNTPRLWSGIPPRSQDLPVVSTQSQVLELPPGLYLVDVPQARLRQGFEVLGPAKVEIQEAGEPIETALGGEMFQLQIDPNAPDAEIFVIDSRFSLVDRDSGRLTSKLPFGLFKIKTRIGRSFTNRVVLFDHDYIPASEVSPSLLRTPVLVAPSDMPPQQAAFAPLAGMAAKHEYQQIAAEEGRKSLLKLSQQGKQAGLMLMVRVWTGEQGYRRDFVPWEGISLVNAKGKLIADLPRDGTCNQQVADPYCVLTMTVKPGVYYLRQRLDGGIIVEQSLILTEGWGLEVYILHNPSHKCATDQQLCGEVPQVPLSDNQQVTGGISIGAAPKISMIMSSLNPGATGNILNDRILESALIALVNERAILNQELEILLLDKFQDPLAGIIGGHLLLIEHERKPHPHRSLSTLNTVVENLRNLVGSDHPDVEALSLRCPDEKLRCRSPIMSPPMFQRSWKFLVDATYENSRLIPKDVFSRIECHTTLPPFLVWAVDDDIKATWRKHVSLALFQQEKNSAMGIQAGQAGMIIEQGLQVKTSRKQLTQLLVGRAHQMGLPHGMIATLSKELGDDRPT
jgi:hypothetical protein